MRKMRRLARAVRCDTTDPSLAFRHRIRIGLMVAALILILSIIGG